MILERLNLEQAAKVLELVLRTQATLLPAVFPMEAECAAPDLRLPYPVEVVHLHLGSVGGSWMAEIGRWIDTLGGLNPEVQLAACTPGVANWLITEARSLRKSIWKEQA